MGFNRRKTRQIYIGNVPVGGDAPISIQSMTSCKTSDIKAVVKEIQRLRDAGCDIVRVGVPDSESAEAISVIKKKVSIPIVADIHFDYRLALLSIKSGADGLRINPGNLKNKEHVKEVVKACKEKRIPIRIGVNSGSIDRKRFTDSSPEALVESAMEHIRLLEEEDFFDIKVSLKSSDVPTMVKAYRLFAPLNDYPLHLGVTEAGTYNQAIIKSAAGIGCLLLEGIGDTIRISITGDPVKEVEAAKILLRTLNLRKEGVEIISCPTCARKEFDVEKIAKKLEGRTQNIKTYIKVAVMGCVVNGPGEAMDADVGIAVGKSGAVLFKKGKIVENVPKERILRVLLQNIEDFR